jgi:CRP-like cAMP-binding protein
MRDETMDRLLGLMTEMEFKKNEIVIPYGKIDNNVYILKSGIVRFVYIDGHAEKTFGFATSGLMISYYAFYMRNPYFFQVETCCDSTVMKIAKRDFLDLIETSDDFTRWMMWSLMKQLSYNEKKLDVFNGDANERFESLIKNRPEILEQVSSKIIASYVGVTPIYLCALKRKIAQKHKK